MIRPVAILPLLAVLAATPAWAQETAAEGDAPAEAAEPADAPEAAEGEAPQPGPPGTELDTGEAVAPGGAPQPVDNTYVKAEYGDWDLQCLRVEEGEEPCQMYQLLQDQSGASVAEVSLFRVANGGQIVAGGTFVVPLETLLTQKMTMQVDSGQAKRYDFSFCTQVGCYARVGFTEEDVARFRAGANAAVTIVPALAPDQKVTVTMSLSGFTAAYNEVTALRQ